jgi:hypothetical protein
MIGGTPPCTAACVSSLVHTQPAATGATGQPPLVGLLVTTMPAAGCCLADQSRPILRRTTRRHRLRGRPSLPPPPMSLLLVGRRLRAIFCSSAAAAARGSSGFCTASDESQGVQ